MLACYRPGQGAHTKRQCLCKLVSTSTREQTGQCTCAVSFSMRMPSLQRPAFFQPRLAYESYYVQGLVGTAGPRLVTHASRCHHTALRGGARAPGGREACRALAWGPTSRPATGSGRPLTEGGMGKPGVKGWNMLRDHRRGSGCIVGSVGKSVRVRKWARALGCRGPHPLACTQPTVRKH